MERVNVIKCMKLYKTVREHKKLYENVRKGWKLYENVR